MSVVQAEIDQLRTELKERDNEVSSLAAANKHLQRKVDAANANSEEMKVRVCAVLIVVYRGDYHKICVHLH